MSRKKREIDKEEIEEIIKLHIEKLNGAINNITYNGVYKFNKEISNNQKYLRSNGSLFKLYGYDFWAGCYNGEDYYGKRRIDEIKNDSIATLTNYKGPATIEDLLSLIDDLEVSDPKLIKKLIKIYEKQNSKINSLEKDISTIRKTNELLNNKIKLLEEGITNLFHQSQYSTNSLQNMLSLKNSDDSFCYNELLNMFNNDNERIIKLINSSPITEKKIKLEKKNSKIINLGL